jgi:hypothetical protein
MKKQVKNQVDHQVWAQVRSQVSDVFQKYILPRENKLKELSVEK